jgi:hypothetical protein
MSNMNRITNIGIIGDYNPDHLSHQATNAAIGHLRSLPKKARNILVYMTPSGCPRKVLTGAWKALLKEYVLPARWTCL